MPDPLEQLAVLREKMEQIAVDAGLELEGFAIIPGHQGEQHHCQAVFKIDPKTTFKSAEERETDKIFRDMMMQERIEAHETAVEDITTSGADLLKGLESLGNGIGLDDDGESDDNPGDPAGV